MDQLPQQDIYLESARSDVAPFIPVTARSALDVGCGRGGFGRTLRATLGPSARIVGIEPVPAQAALARSTGFDEVFDGYFPDALGGRDERFDLISFNDVIEHILDPWAMLDQVHDRLNPGGHVLAAIPSIRYFPVLAKLVGGRWDYADGGTLDRTHVRFFTKATMIEMFERAGFEVETVKGANPVFSMRRLHTPLRPLRHLLGSTQWMHYVILARSTRAHAG